MKNLIYTATCQINVFEYVCMFCGIKHSIKHGNGNTQVK